MKIKIWTVTSDDRNGHTLTNHATKAEAEAEFRTRVSASWEDFGRGEPMPDDPHEAFDQLTAQVGFMDTHSLDEQELEVPFPDFNPDIEAALCTWEWLLSSDQDELYESVADGIGSPGMRMVSVHAGQIVLSVYELMEARGLELTYCYDYQFVPGVLKQLDWPTLVENNQYGDQSYRPDPAPLLEQLVQSNPNWFHDVWIETAKREARKQWSYEDLVTEHEDRIDRTEKPAEWVKRIGEKYDLTPAGSW